MKPLFLLLLFTLTGLAQSKPRFPDGRTTAICQECVETLASRPKEVLYGISIVGEDVYFTISNKEWLGRLIKEDDDAISADLVAKDQYACGKPAPGINGYAKGIFLDPVYRPALMAKIVDMEEGIVSIPPYHQHRCQRGPPLLLCQSQAHQPWPGHG